jgi:flagellar motor protein MotB
VSRGTAPRARAPRLALGLARLAPSPWVALAALGLAPLWLAACANTAAERDRLAERVQQLEAQSQSLAGERDRQAEQLEDLRQERDRLAKQASALGDAQAQLAARQRELDEKTALAASQEALIHELEAEASASAIQVEGLALSLAADSLFAPGSADLTKPGEVALARVAGDLRGRPYRIEVQGHGDNGASKGAQAARYPTSWELAGARAARVVRFFAAHGVDPARLSAVSLGAEHPVASNDSADGRAQNRRIEIRAIPLASAPAAQPPGSTPAQPAGSTGSP